MKISMNRHRWIALILSIGLASGWAVNFFVHDNTVMEWWYPPIWVFWGVLIGWHWWSKP